MSTSREHLLYVLDCLRECPEITYRSMMGEYLLYCAGTYFGGVFDGRFLVKIVPSSLELLPEAVPELPYTGGSPMLPVASEDPVFLKNLVERMLPELPKNKQRRKK